MIHKKYVVLILGANRFKKKCFQGSLTQLGNNSPSGMSAREVLSPQNECSALVFPRT